MKRMNVKNLLAGALLCFAVSAFGNDGVYFTSGNQLVPLQESDISVSREVLSIDLNDDGFARVDVKYEFLNNGPQKTVLMGFEAPIPYNDDEKFSPEGVHPHIFDFSVVMNGQKLPYRNAVVIASNDEQPATMKPLDLNKWKFDNEDDFQMRLYSKDGKDTVDYAYAYYFDATFKPGINTVHHTYRYRMSYGVGRAFEVAYLLTPAGRWAGGKIGDFTLVISANNTAKHFFVPDIGDSSIDFKVTKGTGKIRRGTGYEYAPSYTEISLRNGAVQWHATNFKPEKELQINSADMLDLLGEDKRVGVFYDRSDQYYPYMIWGTFSEDGVNAAELEWNKRILRNLPFASRGYVFKDKKLRDYFSKLWWYMPDPQWKSSTKGFTKNDLKMINESKKAKPFSD